MDQLHARDRITKLAKVTKKLIHFNRSTFISNKLGGDPWVIFWEGHYYYCRADKYIVMVSKADRLEDIGRDTHIVWSAPNGNDKTGLWAPELHRINDKWYIYFSMGWDLGHRMYVLEGLTDDPQGEYEFKGKLSEPSDQWAIDNTVFFWKDKWYCSWSGYDNATSNDPQSPYPPQNLYIAEMSSPTKIIGNRVCISRPVYKWEKQGAGIWPHINEGPQALEHNGKLFIIYSASHSLTDDYCLGQLELVGDDPLLPTSWIKKPEPVFSKHGTIYGPGHASFIEKPDGTDWIIYHTVGAVKDDWDTRILRIQQFGWHADGSPNFGKPRLTKETKIIEKFKKLSKRKR